MARPLLIQSVRIIDPSERRDAMGDLYVQDGRLQPVPAGLPVDVQRLDGRGLVAAPGLIDAHVHFRDPGGTDAEDLRSGALAAARGGFTQVVTMPNTRPACDDATLVTRQTDPTLPVRVRPSACLTRGRLGKDVADLDALAAAGAVAFTDDGSMVPDDAVMAEAMRRAACLGRPVMDHAIDARLMGRGVIRDCALARRLAWPIMPPEAEVAAVARDIRLCRETGCALHIQHVSCAGSIDAIRAARREGLPVTAEASPHHLLLSVDDIPGDDGNYRMNPPLGTPVDVAALRTAVLDGTVGILATDHAPHAPTTKDKGFLAAPFRVIGLETAIGVTHEVLVRGAGMPLHDWIACWTVAPARLLGLPEPTLRIADTPADFILMDLTTPWRVDPTAFASKSRNCPFAGRPLTGRAVLTFCMGRCVWSDPTCRETAPALPHV